MTVFIPTIFHKADFIQIYKLVEFLVQIVHPSQRYYVIPYLGQQFETILFAVIYLVYLIGKNFSGNQISGYFIYVVCYRFSR